jgi:hypothetical protein
MSNDNAHLKAPDLWSLLPGSGESSPPVTGEPREENAHQGRDPPVGGGEDRTAPPQAGTRAEARHPAADWPQDWAGDWRAALQGLQDALGSTATEGEEAPPAIAPEQVTAPMRDRLPEITWRVLALLDQIPERGAIRLTALREVVGKAGTCDLCGDALKDPQHFPPRCELCVLAARLALGYLSLPDLLCAGGQGGTSAPVGDRRGVVQQLVHADVVEEGAPDGQEPPVVDPVRVVGPT